MNVGEFADAGQPSRIHRLRQPEVEHLDDSVRADLDVGRLEVAVDDPVLVRRFERLGDLFRDRQRLLERDRPVRDARREVLAVDELHHERLLAARLLEAEHRRDVRMVKLGQKLRLQREPLQTLDVLDKRRGEHLDRDVAIQPRIARAVDFSHSARADGLEDHERSKPGCRSQGHWQSATSSSAA